ncbi:MULTISPECIES: alpha amylase C-terminal domain-containing protein [unclassified Bradyrhizobium]
MPADMSHVGPHTPMGANLLAGGATFRAWAPRASAVYVTGSFNRWIATDENCRLVRDANGYWAGFIPGVTEGAQYKFYVVGADGPGYKRDPYARELVAPDWNCVVSDQARYPWHDASFHPPAYEELIIYQLHIGTFYAVDANGLDRRGGRVAKFLDVLDRVPYLADLGVTAVQPLPIVEFPTAFSLGYNGVDYFSPEFEYGVPVPELPRYVDRANALLTARGHAPVSVGDVRGADDQLRLLIDILHVYGIAVIFDVVYNHAGGDFGNESLYFFDRARPGNNNDSLYFTDRDWAGGLVFAYWNASVRQFLIDNAVAMMHEFHIDGFRYDEVSVIDRFGGWYFCQDLTSTVRTAKPSAVQIAEFWNPGPDWVIRPSSSGGAGFDMVWSDRMRDSVRSVVEQVSHGAFAPISLERIRDALMPPAGFDGAWRAVQMLENHDVLLTNHEPKDQKPRIAHICDPSDARSWYARSRARVANGILLTGPGVPMLFMGQEFLEDKLWSDSPHDPNHRIWWDGLDHDRAMSNHLRFTRELIALRRRLRALRRGRINIFHCHNPTRVLAFHRWLEDLGDDVVVVTSLSETTYFGYRLGLPHEGIWHEVFNSDVYDNWVNPIVAGNGGGVLAAGPPLHGMPTSAEMVIPANGLIVLARN